MSSLFPVPDFHQASQLWHHLLTCVGAALCVSAAGFLFSSSLECFKRLVEPGRGECSINPDLVLEASSLAVVGERKQ